MVNEVIKDALKNIDTFTQRLVKHTDFEVYVDYIDENTMKRVEGYVSLDEFPKHLQKWRNNYYQQNRLLAAFYDVVMRDVIPNLNNDSEKLRVQMTPLEQLYKLFEKENKKQKTEESKEQELPEKFIVDVEEDSTETEP